MATIRAALIAGVFLLTALVVVPLSWLAPGAAPFAIRMACRAVLALLRIRVSVHGAPRAGLLVANHVSWIDVLIVLSRAPACFLAKSEVGGWPLVASLAGAQGTIFVDRRRRRCIPAVNAAMAERLAAGHVVVLFPEGTTHDGGGCGAFHTSHLACLRSLFARAPSRQGVAVQPVALHYADPTAAWVGDDALLPHLWRVLQRPAITGELRFGRAITVERGYDRKALGRALRGEIEAMLVRQPASERAPATRIRQVPGAEGRLDPARAVDAAADAGA